MRMTITRMKNSHLTAPVPPDSPSTTTLNLVFISNNTSQIRLILPEHTSLGFYHGEHGVRPYYPGHQPPRRCCGPFFDTNELSVMWRFMDIVYLFQVYQLTMWCAYRVRTDSP
jgi:hypothetical protein